MFNRESMRFAEVTMTSWEKFKSRWGLFVGSIGLVADTITILGAISAGLILPSVSNVKIVSSAFDTLVLLTAIFGTYFLTLIVWFLFRWRRAKQDIKTFGFDELYSLPSPGFPTFNIVFSLIPLVGPFGGMMTHASIRTIFWLAVFISLLPTTLWLYLVAAQVWTACGAGLIGSFFISQYATFFALVLDRFFESKML